jgi:hypothetical protein
MECGVSAEGEDATRRIEQHGQLMHSGPLIRLRAAANALADARVRFAQEFARQKLLTPGMTDKAAIYAATEVTNDDVTRLEAELEIARRMSCQ